MFQPYNESGREKPGLYQVQVLKDGRRVRNMPSCTACTASHIERQYLGKPEYTVIVTRAEA